MSGVEGSADIKKFHYAAPVAAPTLHWFSWYTSTWPSYVATYSLPSATMGGQNLLNVKLTPALVLSHSSFSLVVPSAFFAVSNVVASYARAIPGANSLFALRSMGASVQTIPLLVPLELSASIPPVMPP